MDMTDEDREFRKLFWAARLEHGAIRSGQDGASCRSHLQACSLAAERNWPWVAGLLDASAKALAGHLHEATTSLAEVENTVPAQHRSLVTFLQSSLAYLNRDYPKALELGAQLVADPLFDRKGYAHSNRGEAFVALEQFDDAIASYRQALQEPDYDYPAYALNNLGRILLLKKKDAAQAIVALKKAAESPPAHVRSETFYYMGLAFQEQGDLAQALECFHKSLESPAPKERYQLDSMKQIIAIRQEMGNHSSLSPDESALVRLWNRDPANPTEAMTPEGRVAAKIMKARETQYDKYVRMGASNRNGELHILRGWSSAVTLIEGSQRLWRGGGYFIKWKGKGIVIDPGFDFLRNFHDEGFHASEINAVIVSHNHPDHNADLKSIDDLCYEVHARSRGTATPYDLLLDEDTRGAASWTRDHSRHRKDAVIFDYGRCNPVDTYQPQGAEFAVRYFRVSHSPDVPHAVGFCLDLYDGNEVKVRLGYTGDTCFFPELPALLANCDMLIGHISQPSLEELFNVTQMKAMHLGYRGLIELVRLAKPRLTLVGEFWAGLEDLRIDLVDGVRKMSSNSRIFPTSIGMGIGLERGTINCSTCDFPILPDQIRVTPATEPFGPLGYHCPVCTLG